MSSSTQLALVTLCACARPPATVHPPPFASIREAPASGVQAVSRINKHASPQWDYSAGESGPSHWGELSPGFALCSTGHAQSPVDLAPEEAQPIAEPLSLHAEAFPLIEVNAGHTIRWSVAGASTLSWAGHTWTLAQFHVHTPSEHTVHGVHAPMEMHFVLRDTQGALAVLGVLVVKGEGSPAVRTLLSDPPAHLGESRTPAGTTVDLSTLLPVDLHYEIYSGSLTTPPCSEGVTWFVLDAPIQASEAQIEALHGILGDNARPTQTWGERVARRGP